MGTRTHVSLFLVGAWLTFLAFLLFIFLTAEGYFSLFTCTALIISFILNWVLVLHAHELILLRAEKLRQMKWLLTFKVWRHVPVVLSCVDTVYAITWPDLPERERRVVQ